MHGGHLSSARKLHHDTISEKNNKNNIYKRRNKKGFGRITCQWLAKSNRFGPRADRPTANDDLLVT